MQGQDLWTEFYSILFQGLIQNGAVRIRNMSLSWFVKRLQLNVCFPISAITAVIVTLGKTRSYKPLRMSCLPKELDQMANMDRW